MVHMSVIAPFCNGTTCGMICRVGRPITLSVTFSGGSCSGTSYIDCIKDLSACQTLWVPGFITWFRSCSGWSDGYIILTRRFPCTFQINTECMVKLDAFDASVFSRQNTWTAAIGGDDSSRTKLLGELLAHTQLSKLYALGKNANSYSDMQCKDFSASTAVEQDIPHISRGCQGERVVGVVIDGMLLDRTFFSQRNVRSLYSCSRSYRQSVFVSAALDLPPAVRANADYAFLFWSNDPEERGIMWTRYGTCFDSQRDFDAALSHDCLVMDYTSRSCVLKDCVFTYKLDSQNYDT